MVKERANAREGATAAACLSSLCLCAAVWLICMHARSLSPDGKKDPHSLHGSCPTLKGDKWSGAHAFMLACGVCGVCGMCVHCASWSWAWEGGRSCLPHLFIPCTCRLAAALYVPPGAAVIVMSVMCSDSHLASPTRAATKWIHVAPFRVASDGTHSPDATPDGDCVDTSPHCAAWAAAGECRSNAQYMLSACRASCGGCAAGHAAMADAVTAPFAAA